MGKSTGFLSAKDGTRIYYEVEGTGPALIFCYGLLCRREHWRYQIDFFRKDYQIITFDYRGHQLSALPKNQNNLTLAWCASDIRELMDHLSLPSAVVLGHSLGVAVISQLIKSSPERLQGVVMICGAVENPFQHMFFTNKMDTIYRNFAWAYEWTPSVATRLWKMFTDPNHLSYFLAKQFGFNANRANHRDVQMYLQGVRETSLETFQLLLKDYTRYDGLAALKAIQCPALVIGGEEDCITPIGLIQKMASAIPGCEFEMVHEGSHNTHMDFPDEVNQRIEEFLAKLEPR